MATVKRIHELMGDHFDRYKDLCKKEPVAVEAFKAIGDYLHYGAMKGDQHSEDVLEYWLAGDPNSNFNYDGWPK